MNEQDRKLMLRINDVTMRFRMEEDHTTSLKETVTKIAFENIH